MIKEIPITGNVTFSGYLMETGFYNNLTKKQRGRFLTFLEENLDMLSRVPESEYDSKTPEIIEDIMKKGYLSNGRIS